MEARGGPTQPVEAESASLEVIDRAQRLLWPEPTGDVTDRPGQPDAGDAINHVAVFRSDGPNPLDESGERPDAPTTVADHLDRRITIEPVDPMQPRRCRAGNEKASASRMCGHPQSLADGLDRGGEDQHAGGRLAQQRGIQQAADIRRSEADINRLLARHRSILFRGQARDRLPPCVTAQIE